MIEESGTEAIIAQLSKRIDEQARFTRSVVIICTLTMLGIMFYTLKEIFTDLPSAIVLTYMGNIDAIVQEWKLAEHAHGGTGGFHPLPPAPAPPGGLKPPASKDLLEKPSSESKAQ